MHAGPCFERCFCERSPWDLGCAKTDMQHSQTDPAERQLLFALYQPCDAPGARAVLARDLPDRDPWPDPAAKHAAPEPAAGGQFAFGRRLQLPGQARAPADAGALPKTPPLAEPAEAAGPAPLRRQRSQPDARRRASIAGLKREEGGPTRAKRVRASQGRLGSPETGLRPRSGAGGARTPLSGAYARADAREPGDVPGNSSESDDPEPDPEPEVRPPRRRSLPLARRSVRRVPSRPRRVTMFVGPRPARVRASRAPAARLRACVQRTAAADMALADDGAHAAAQEAQPGEEPASDSGSAGALDLQTRFTSSSPAAGHRRMGLAAAQRVRGKSIAFALDAARGSSSPDYLDASWDLEVRSDGGGGHAGPAARPGGRESRLQGALRRGRSRGPPAEPDAPAAERLRQASQTPALPEPYQVVDLVRRRAGAASGLAAELGQLNPDPRARARRTRASPSQFPGSSPEHGPRLGALAARALVDGVEAAAEGAWELSPGPAGAGPVEGTEGGELDATFGQAAGSAVPAEWQRWWKQRSTLARGLPARPPIEDGGAGAAGDGAMAAADARDDAVPGALSAPWAGVRASALREGLGLGARARAGAEARTTGRATYVVVPAAEAHPEWLEQGGGEAGGVPAGGRGAPRISGLQLLGVSVAPSSAPQSRASASPRAPRRTIQLGWGLPRVSAALHPRPAAPPVPPARQAAFDGAISAVSLTAGRGLPGSEPGSAAASRPATGQQAVPELPGFVDRARVQPSVWRGRAKLAPTPRPAAPLAGEFALVGAGLGTPGAAPE